MHPLLSALALSLALQAPPTPGAPAARVPEAPPGEEVKFTSDYDDPPKGSPEELALWKAGIDATRRVNNVRQEAFNLRARVKGAELSRRLGERRTQVPSQEAEPIARLKRSLDLAWNENVELYTRRWPVDPTRGCGYPHLYYDNALRLAPEQGRNAEVANTTPELKGCLERARAACDRMEASTRELAALVAEAEALLGPWKAGGPGSAAAPAAGPGPKGEGAGPGEQARGKREAGEAHERHERHEQHEAKEQERK